MGCASSRIDVSCEEAAMINGDYKLYFYDYDVQKLYSEFKQISEHGKVSLKAFKKLAKTLPLIYDKNDEVIAFYSKFLHEKHFELKILAALAVLLSTGSTAAKVEVLHENWIEGEHVSKEHFAHMLNVLFDLSINDLPVLASKPDAVNSYTEESFNFFLERARAGRDPSKEAILSALFEKEPVSKATVLAWAQTGENHHWLDAQHIRAELKKAGKRILHRKKKEKTEASAEVHVSGSLGKGGLTVSEEHGHHHGHEKVESS